MFNATYAYTNSYYPKAYYAQPKCRFRRWGYNGDFGNFGGKGNLLGREAWIVLKDCSMKVLVGDILEDSHIVKTPVAFILFKFIRIHLNLLRVDSMA